MESGPSLRRGDWSHVECTGGAAADGPKWPQWPSTALGVLLGRTSNGRVQWKAANGRTLKDIHEPGGKRTPRRDNNSSDATEDLPLRASELHTEDTSQTHRASHHDANFAVHSQLCDPAQRRQ